MPTFIDHHEMSDVAPEMAAAIGERIKAGEADDHGVKGLNVFLGKDGTAFCLSEAPDADAVVKAHQAYGFSLDSADVVEVQSVV
ncbi:MAG TPA: nickel-binding protein [Gaiellaceae bacterium]|nr:nickel-binding protein [Gaiellaceae bacterium]